MASEAVANRIARLKSRPLFVTPKAVQAPVLVPAPPLPLDDPSAHKDAERERISGRVGSIQRLEPPYAYVWLFDLIRTAGRGRRVGNIDRDAEPVLTKVHIPTWSSVETYRNRIYARMNLSEFRGKSVGNMNIQYSGGGNNLEWRASPTGAVKPRGTSPDRYEDGSNDAEDFVIGDLSCKSSDARVDPEKDYVGHDLYQHADVSKEEFITRELAKFPDRPLETIEQDWEGNTPHYVEPQARSKGIWAPPRNRLDYMDQAAAKRARAEKKADREVSRLRFPHKCAREECLNATQRLRFCSKKCAEATRSQNYRLRKRLSL